MAFEQPARLAGLGVDRDDGGIGIARRIVDEKGVALRRQRYVVEKAVLAGNRGGVGVFIAPAGSPSDPSHRDI